MTFCPVTVASSIGYKTIWYFRTDFKTIRTDARRAVVVYTGLNINCRRATRWPTKILDNARSVSTKCSTSIHVNMSQTEPEPTLWDELTSPVNFTLLLVIVYLIYKILRAKFEPEPEAAPPIQRLPKLRKDLTVQELKKYDGTQPDGRVLLAVNGVIFDVTRGKSFYGPGKWRLPLLASKPRITLQAECQSQFLMLCH